MQPTRSAKGQKGIIGGVYTFSDGDAADGIGHFLIGDMLEAPQQLLFGMWLPSSLLHLPPDLVQSLPGWLLINWDAHQGRV